MVGGSNWGRYIRGRRISRRGYSMGGRIDSLVGRHHMGEVPFANSNFATPICDRCVHDIRAFCFANQNSPVVIKGGESSILGGPVDAFFCRKRKINSSIHPSSCRAKTGLPRSSSKPSSSPISRTPTRPRSFLVIVSRRAAMGSIANMASSHWCGV